MPRKLEIEDLARIVVISDPRISPDGMKIAFTSSKMDLERDKYVSRIWIADLKENEIYSLTNGPKDSSPRWSRSGRYIAFLGKRSMKEGEKGSELWLIRIDGGEARMILKRKLPISKFCWLPEDKELIFLGGVGSEQEDVKIVERIRFWYNGKGFIHPFRQHVHLLNVNSGECIQLTKGDFDVNFISVSNSGDKVAYIATLNDLKPYVNDLFILDLKTGESRQLTSSNMSMDFVSWSPDDSKLIVRGHMFSRGLISHRRIYSVNVEEGSITNLTAKIGLNTSNSLNSDVRGGRGDNGPIWLDEYIYFLIHDGGSVNLHRLNIKDKEIEPVTIGERSVEAFTVSKTNSNHIVAFTSMTALEPKELYIWHSTKGERKITDFNSTLLKELKLSSPEHFKFKASDGVNVDGWILKPPNHGEGKCPAILYIHGGPKTAFGNSFMHELQLYASKGYAVIYMNPRGSDGYSEEFADIRGHYGERDYKDLMEGLNYAVKKFNFIDEMRIGVAGGSYGGFMTNWIVTHTDRFKAAVSMRGISNWFSFYGVSDIGYTFSLDHILGDLASKPLKMENIMKFIDKSPIIYAENVKTPILIIHSLEDLRCHYEQAFQFFVALKHLEKEAKLILFPKDTHDLSRTGKPKHRIERLKQILEWFDKHLK